jgi:phosphopantothenoylcysteine decarboxylase/phosphopantothenate--cysteine ligase
VTPEAPESSPRPARAQRRPLRVLLGVSGGIAGYKAIEIVRRLKADGHEVRCALTRAATAFVTPLSLEVLSGHQVYQEEYLAGDGSGRELHISLAQWADVLCVAPATAHTLARLALGLGDDFLSTTALAFDGPVLVAPAMHSVMWDQDSVVANVERLRSRGVRFVGPEVGALASGEVGMGRMADPQEIVQAVGALAGRGRMAGRRVVISAGPTHEAVDPVRFISNRSTGKMGFALATAAAAAGAQVQLVAGPVALPDPAGVERLDVTTAEEMREAIYSLAPGADLVIMTAAVADFRPRNVAPRKIKKGAGLDAIELEPTADILAGLRAVAPEALLVGFAAETDHLEENAKEKLTAKELDFIVANDVSRSDIGFESDQNEVIVLGGGTVARFERQPKRELAERLLGHFLDTVGKREREPVA